MVHSNREQFVINERLNSTKHYHRQLQWEYLLGIGEYVRYGYREFAPVKKKKWLTSTRESSTVSVPSMKYHAFASFAPFLLFATYLPDID